MARRAFVMLLAGVLGTSVTLGAQRQADDQAIENIRRALMRLPYYGVFDFLAFQYDRGTVTLSGFAYRPLLKKEAVDAVRKVQRVDDVVDQIEELPVSQNDDDIRWATFERIYTDAFLSRYAPGGGLVRFDRRFDVRLFPGMQPFGTYPIHIVVKGGRTTLIGEVDSESDKTLAGFRAREVPGTFGVENDLSVRSRRRAR